MIKTNKNTIWMKLISLIVLTSFLCQTMAWGYPYDFKLAVTSRFSKYLKSIIEKEQKKIADTQITQDSMYFAMVSKELHKAVVDENEKDVSKIISVHLNDNIKFLSQQVEEIYIDEYVFYYLEASFYGVNKFVFFYPFGYPKSVLREIGIENENDEYFEQLLPGIWVHYLDNIRKGQVSTGDRIEAQRGYKLNSITGVIMPVIIASITSITISILTWSGSAGVFVIASAFSVLIFHELCHLAMFYRQIPPNKAIEFANPFQFSREYLPDFELRMLRLVEKESFAFMSLSPLNRFFSHISFIFRLFKGEETKFSEEKVRIAGKWGGFAGAVFAGIMGDIIFSDPLYAIPGYFTALLIAAMHIKTEDKKEIYPHFVGYTPFEALEKILPDLRENMFNFEERWERYGEDVEKMIRQWTIGTTLIKEEELTAFEIIVQNILETDTKSLGFWRNFCQLYFNTSNLEKIEQDDFFCINPIFYQYIQSEKLNGLRFSELDPRYMKILTYIYIMVFVTQPEMSDFFIELLPNAQREDRDADLSSWFKNMHLFLPDASALVREYQLSKNDEVKEFLLVCIVHGYSKFLGYTPEQLVSGLYENAKANTTSEAIQRLMAGENILIVKNPAPPNEEEQRILLQELNYEVGINGFEHDGEFYAFFIRGNEHTVKLVTALPWGKFLFNYHSHSWDKHKDGSLHPPIMLASGQDLFIKTDIPHYLGAGRLFFYDRPSIEMGIRMEREHPGVIRVISVKEGKTEPRDFPIEDVYILTTKHVDRNDRREIVSILNLRSGEKPRSFLNYLEALYHSCPQTIEIYIPDPSAFLMKSGPDISFENIFTEARREIERRDARALPSVEGEIVSPESIVEDSNALTVPQEDITTEHIPIEREIVSSAGNIYKDQQPVGIPQIVVRTVNEADTIRALVLQNGSTPSSMNPLGYNRVDDMHMRFIYNDPHAPTWSHSNRLKILDFVSRLPITDGEKVVLTVALVGFIDNTPDIHNIGSLRRLRWNNKKRTISMQFVNSCHYAIPVDTGEGPWVTVNSAIVMYEYGFDKKMDHPLVPDGEIGVPLPEDPWDRFQFRLLATAARYYPERIKYINDNGIVQTGIAVVNAHNKPVSKLYRTGITLNEAESRIENMFERIRAAALDLFNVSYSEEEIRKYYRSLDVFQREILFFNDICDARKDIQLLYKERALYWKNMMERQISSVVHELKQNKQKMRAGKITPDELLDRFERILGDIKNLQSLIEQLPSQPNEGPLVVSRRTFVKGLIATGVVLAATNFSGLLKITEAKAEEKLPPGRVEIKHELDGYRFYINGQRTDGIPGMVYQNVPSKQIAPGWYMPIEKYIERYGYSALYEGLLDKAEKGEGHAKILTEDMGVKAIRIYCLPTDNEDDIEKTKRIFRRVHKQYGLMVMAGTYAGLYDHAGSSATDRKAIKTNVRKMVEIYGKEPWLLAWQLGNENDLYLKDVGKLAHILGVPLNMTGQAYYNFMDELAGIVKVTERKEGLSHPVVLGHGDPGKDLDIVNMIAGMKNVDAVGLNLFRGVNDFNDLFGRFKEAEKKAGRKIPLIISEFGKSVYRDPQQNVPKEQAEQEQLNYNLRAWKAICDNMAGRQGYGNLLGGFCFIFTDQWFFENSNTHIEAHFGVLGRPAQDIFKLAKKAVTLREDEPSDVLLAKAWQALDNRQFDTAIKAAEIIIRRHEEQAIKEQLEKSARIAKGEKFDYAAGDETAKQKIQSFGSLNMIGAALFIAGKAYKGKQNYKEANKYFEKIVKEYPLAEIWDMDGSQDWFWKPAEAAKKEQKSIAPLLLIPLAIDTATRQHPEAESAFENAVRADIKFTQELLGEIKDNGIYEIRYDAHRLSQSQQELIKEYGNKLGIKSISAKPNGNYIIKVTRRDTDRRGIGEGKINITSENTKDIFGDYPLRLIGMLNITLAASNIPEQNIKDSPLSNFIKKQFKEITGRELKEEEDIKNLILPKPKKIDIDRVDEFNRLAKKLLISA